MWQKIMMEGHWYNAIIELFRKKWKRIMISPSYYNIRGKQKHNKHCGLPMLTLLSLRQSARAWQMVSPGLDGRKEEKVLTNKNSIQYMHK